MARKKWEYPWDKSHPIESICVSRPMFITMIASFLTSGALSLFDIIKNIQPYTPIWNVTVGFYGLWIGSTLLFDGGMAWHAIREKLEYKKTLRWLEKHKNDYNEVDKEEEKLTQAKLKSEIEEKSNKQSQTDKSNHSKMMKAYKNVIDERRTQKGTTKSHFEDQEEKN